MLKNLDYSSDHDLAVSIACNKYEEKYPEEMQPRWLKYCMSMRTRRNQKGNWVIQFVLSPKPKLKPGQYLVWRDDGIPALVESDSVTGRKSVVICGGPAVELEVFFEVEVDSAKKSAIVHIDIDPNNLDAAQYEINRR